MASDDVAHEILIRLPLGESGNDLPQQARHFFGANPDARRSRLVPQQDPVERRNHVSLLVQVAELLLADAVLIPLDRLHHVVQQGRGAAALRKQQLAEENAPQVLRLQNAVGAEDLEHFQLLPGRGDVQTRDLLLFAVVGDGFVRSTAAAQHARQGRAPHKTDHQHDDHHRHYLRVVLTKPFYQVHASLRVFSRPAHAGGNGSYLFGCKRLKDTVRVRPFQEK